MNQYTLKACQSIKNNDKMSPVEGERLESVRGAPALDYKTDDLLVEYDRIINIKNEQLSRKETETLIIHISNKIEQWTALNKKTPKMAIHKYVDLLTQSD